jgi:hypothetical protein
VFYNPDDPRAPNGWREWEKRECKLTLAAALVYWSPVFWMIAARMSDDGGGNVWKGGTLFTVPLGIALSRGTWRRVLAAVFWLSLMIFGHESRPDSGFVPWLLLLLWVGSFYWVWFQDGQERNRKAKRRDWEG